MVSNRVFDMKTGKQTRRGLLAGFAAVTGGLFLTRPAESTDPTPRAAEGPFYPRPGMRVADVDNDLVKIDGKVREAKGEIILLKGTILDKSGRPLGGRRIEIWQCDMKGKYLHPGDRQNIVHDSGFQGFGHDITDANGGYRFRTIRPVSYPGRAPHIHVKVLDGTKTLLTTQFYIKGHPGNDGDFLFRRMSAAEAAMVSMDFAGAGEATVNVIV